MRLDNCQMVRTPGAHARNKVQMNWFKPYGHNCKTFFILGDMDINVI